MAAIVESSEDAIISTDLNGIITSWNPAAERLYGYLASEIVGQPNHLIIPVDRQAEEELVRRRIASGQPVEHYESVRLREDGRRVDVALTVSSLRGRDGRIIGISKISRDISERHRIDSIKEESLAAVRQLAAIVESSDDGIIGMTLDGTITAWNQGAERMYGYTAADALGQSIHRFIPEDRRQEESEVLDRIRRGERVEHFETLRCRKDRTCFPVSLVMSPIRDEAGTVIGASKIARDISEQKRASQQAAFLAEAGAVLAGSLEYLTTLKILANLAVPSIADWCAVDILTEERKLEREQWQGQW